MIDLAIAIAFCKATVLPKLSMFGGQKLWDAAKKHSCPEQAAIATGKRLGATPDEASAIEKFLLAWIRHPKFKDLFDHLQNGNPITFEIAMQGFESPQTDAVAAFSAEEILAVFFEQFCAQLATCDATFRELQDIRRTDAILFAAAETTAHAKAAAENSAEMLQAFREYRDRVPQPQSVSIRDEEANDTRSDGEADLHSCVDTAKRHFEHGKVLLAQEQLISLKQSLDAGVPSDFLRFRIETLLGVCKLKLEDTSSAWDHFQQAKACRPNSCISWSNLANCAIFLGRNDATTFSTQARQLSNKNPFAAAVQILALSSRREDSVIAKLQVDEAWILTEPLCLLSLAQHHYDRAEFDAAELLAKRSIEKDEYYQQSHYMLAAAIFRPLQLHHLESPPFDGIVTGETLARMKSAEAAVNRCIELCEQDDHLVDSARSKILRCAIRCACGDFRGAYDDAIATRDAKPDFAAQVHVAVILMSLNELTLDVVSAIEIPPDADPRVLAVVAHLFNEVNEPRKALNILEKLPGPEAADPLYGNWIHTLLDAMRLCNESAKAESLIAAQLPTHEKIPAVVHAIAVYRLKTGDFKAAEKLLRMIIDSDCLRNWARRDLALVLCELGLIELSISRFAEAAKLFELFLDEDQSTNASDLHNYFLALWNSGAPARVYSKAQRLREQAGRTIPGITDWEIRYLERQGFPYIGEALQIATLLAEEHPYYNPGRKLLHRLQARPRI